MIGAERKMKYFPFQRAQILGFFRTAHACARLL